MICLVVGCLLIGAGVYLVIARFPDREELDRSGVSWGDDRISVWERLPLYDHEERGDFQEDDGYDVGYFVGHEERGDFR